MKKLSKVLLIFLLSFLLAGCGIKEAEGDSRQNSIETLSDDAGSLAAIGSIGEEDRTEQQEDGTASAEGENESEPAAAAGSVETAHGAEPAGGTEETEPTDGIEPGDGTERTDAAEPGEETSGLPEDGTYTSKEDVALYLHLYAHLPSNFITKKEAEKLGWTGGSLEPYAPGMCIGGNRFGNYEGLLPEKEGRVYTECDIDTLGAEKRGAKRIVFSNDGLIYYTEDHYQTFELLYGDE